MCTVASAPKPNQLFFSRAFTSSENSSRSPEAVILARRTSTSTGPLPSSGKCRPFSCGSSNLLSSVNGMSIGTPTASTPSCLGGPRSSRRGEGAIRLGLVRHDAGFRLHADGQRDIAGVDLRLRGGSTDGPHFQPQWRQAGLLAAERNRTAHLGPLFAR